MESLRTQIVAAVSLLALLAILAGCGSPSSTSTQLPSSAAASLSSTSTLQQTTMTTTIAGPVGWRKHTSANAELYLPQALNFDLKDPEAVLLLKDLADSAGPELAALVDNLTTSTASAEIAVGEFSEEALFSSLMVSVSSQVLLPGATLTEIVDAAIAGSGASVDKRAPYTLGDYDAEELIVVGESLSFAHYFVKGASRIWVLTYQSSAEEFAGRLDDFRQSASTFRVVEKGSENGYLRDTICRCAAEG